MKSNFYGNRKSLIAICFCSVFLFGNRIVCIAANHNEGEFVWYNGKQAITYSVSKSVSPVVTVALDMFTGDMKQVTGVLPQKTHTGNTAIKIVQLDKNRSALKELLKQDVPVDSLMSKKDAFFIKVTESSNKKQLLVVGSDGRGTAYGILELSRLAGVSPWVWWGDVTPHKEKSINIACRLYNLSKPLSRVSWNLFE